jgi:hypothetical protein
VKAIEGLIKKEIEWFDIGTVEASEEDHPPKPRRERHEKPKRDHREPREAKAEKPWHEKPEPKSDRPKPHRDRNGRPQRGIEDAPDHGRFHGDNIPAFLMRR